ncbi:efflux RND transporter periplasmic adaptor subunit [Dyella terrae]|uniref:efflux RND transporter periplasmic adaptor subunit n=1 Tax=Dyella terrae TaxID=522259 RepID=UPI0031B81AD1|nr:efflux RND transporter periplasmic adaptor subunit [Dyella terrae]
MKRRLIPIFCAIGLLTAVAVGYGWGHRSTATSAASNGTMAASTPSQPVAYWYDPMVPDQHFDKPGLSPMGMQMVPKYTGANDTSGSVRIDPATVQNLGVRVAPVQRQVLEGEIQAPGTVTWDLREAITVSARADGVITRLHVRAPYITVAAGEPLADLLAPSWSSALAESDALRHTQSPDAQALRGAAQQRLQVLGLTSSDLSGARSVDGGVTLRAPQAGVITSLDVREGQRVTAGQTLMTLNGLTSVWIEAAVPQALAGRLSSGTPVTVSTDALPGQCATGTVETLLPDLDPTTRTQRARIALANTTGHLVPGQFVRVAFTPMSNAPVLVIPTEALIATGDHPRVMVALGDGRFRPVMVQTGRAAGGYTEIVAGLHEGERVVASGQFLIDSEASLSGALERLGADDAAPAAASSASMGGDQ